MNSVFLRSLVAGAVLLSQTVALNAGCNFYPSYSYSYAPTYHAPYVEKVVVEKRVTAVDYLFVPVVSPAYVVGVAAPYVAPPTATPATPAHAPSPCTAEVATLRAELERLKAALGAPPAPPVQPQPQQAPPPMAPIAAAPGKSVFAAKCAGCHDASVAKTKGGKLELFQNGVPLPLPPTVAMESLRQMMSGKMPKNGSLTDQDFTLIQQEILSQPGK